MPKLKKETYQTFQIFMEKQIIPQGLVWNSKFQHDFQREFNTRRPLTFLT